MRQEGGAGERDSETTRELEREKMEMEEGRWQREKERLGNKQRLV